MLYGYAKVRRIGVVVCRAKEKRRIRLSMLPNFSVENIYFLGNLGIFFLKTFRYRTLKCELNSMQNGEKNILNFSGKFVLY